MMPTLLIKNGWLELRVVPLIEIQSGTEGFKE